MPATREVTDRIRRAMPDDLGVVPDSLPVVSFGDPARATTATISLNPSWLEFLAPDGTWLLGERRRLPSLVSLGVEDPRELKDEEVERAIAECNLYFDGPNWYRAWFGWLESLQQAAGTGSYLDGTACHLDLVQWATRPAQGDLPDPVWRRLVEEDSDFLRWQLANTNVKLVYLNGAAVVRWMRLAELVADFEEERLPYQASNGGSSLRVFRAVADGVLFVGWNRPLAGALSKEGRRVLAEWVRDATGGWLDGAQEEDEVPDPSDRRHDGGLEDGHIPLGTRLEGAAALERSLSHWMMTSRRPTVGDVGAFGGSPVIVASIGGTSLVLNRDTKRAAVQAFLVAAASAGGAEELDWHVVANARGVLNRVTYRSDDEPTPGWYAYTPEPLPSPRALG